MGAHPEPIAVIGTGYVGLVTAAGFAQLGSDVYCIDIDKDKLDHLDEGQMPFYEPDLAELVRANRERLHFSTEISVALENARLLLVAVGTPADRRSGAADLTAVYTVIDSIPASDHHVVVMKSTVPAGTGLKIRRHLASQGKVGISYVSCPEFLREGSAVKDFFSPDRVVVGDDDFPPAGQEGPRPSCAGDAVAQLYGSLDAEPICTDVTSAEMIKLASNAFLATKISFINEIASVCDHVGADVVEVARGMGRDPRIGDQFLRAGIGYGGSCFPKDVKALKQLAGNSGYDFRLLEAVIDVNERQRERVIHKLRDHLGTLENTTICLLGLAFKPQTDDMREAPSLALIEAIHADGAAMRVFDPQVQPTAEGIGELLGERIDELHVATDAMDAVDGTDAVVLVTEWEAFDELDWPRVADRMSGTLVIDGRNALDRDAITAAGLVYQGIGRGAPPPCR
jgi:UDPglucose 6-dehydrogenase